MLISHDSIFVATSADKRTWETKGNKIVFSEPGCALDDCGEIIEGESYIFPSNKWENCEKHKEEAEFLNTIQADIFDRLVKSYQKFMGMDVNRKDIDRLLYPWLDYYIDTMYYKFFAIEEIEKKYNELSFCDLQEEEYYYCNIPMDFMAKAATDDWFNLQLYANVAKYKQMSFVKKVNKKSIELQHKEKKDRIKMINQLPQKAIRFLRFRIKDIKLYLWCNFINFISYHAETVVINPTRFLMTNKELIKLILNSKGKIGAYYFDLVKLGNMKYNVQLRNEFPLNKDKPICNFEKFLLERMVYDIPLNCVEGIMENFKDKNSKKYKKIRKIVSVSDAKCDFRAKAFILSQPKHCKWYQIEVGGGADLWDGRTEVEGELRISDIYYTNGWKNEKNKDKIRAFYSPRFYKSFLQKSNSERSGLLYVGTIVPKYRCTHDHNVCRNPEKYVENCLFFLQKLEKANLDVAVRLHNDCGWKIKEKIENNFKGIKIDSLEIPFEKSVSSYKLYVCDYLSTTWGEAYATDTPIIFIGSDYLESYSEIGEWWINKLRQCGIYQESFEKAIEYIINIYDKIDVWWMDVERQKVMKEFAEQYADLPRKYDENVWVKEIINIAKE